jgi:hypothetical protein
MTAPSLQIGYGEYTPPTPVSLLPLRYQIDAYDLWRSQKSEPGFPGSRSHVPVGSMIFSENRFPLFPDHALGVQDTRYYDAGISTVSMTWMTPFD